MTRSPFTFPTWTNHLRNAVALVLLVLVPYVVIVVAFGAAPETTNVGYEPVQPVAYSHLMHAGELGMDCRYCHNTVDYAAHAAIPPTQTCWNCHHGILVNEPTMAEVVASQKSGMPIEWIRVHHLPDYAYFDHSAHINKGVGCVECHGRVDAMEVVYQAEPLSMGWCLECHRNPTPNLRPLDAVTNLRLSAAQACQEAGVTQEQLYELYGIRDAQYLQSCSVCHR